MKDKEIKIKAKTRKEIIQILHKHRSGKKIYMCVDCQINVDDKKMFKTMNSIKIAFKTLIVSLKEDAGLYWQLDSEKFRKDHPEMHINIEISDYCIFI